MNYKLYYHIARGEIYRAATVDMNLEFNHCSADGFPYTLLKEEQASFLKLKFPSLELEPMNEV